MGLSEDLAIIAKQEQRLKFQAFDEESAWRLGCRLRDMALARSAPLVIEVQRFGQPLFFCALAGSTPDNVHWARRKSGVVARSLAIGTRRTCGVGGNWRNPTSS